MRTASTRTASSGYDARESIESWRKDYIQMRPHRSLGYLTPAEFAQLRSLLQAEFAAKPEPGCSHLYNLIKGESSL
jgi:Integrase core domain